MITKKQWNKFCRDVWYIRSKLGYYQVFINGRGIQGIEQRENGLFVIKTIKQNTNLEIYMYQESFPRDNMNLKDLYRQVSISSDMDSLFPFLKKGGLLL